MHACYLVKFAKHPQCILANNRCCLLAIWIAAWNKEILVYIYNWDAIFWVPGSKAPDPLEGFRRKKRFLTVPGAEFTFGRLQDSAKRVQRAVLIVFGAFWELLGTSKTCDSVQYIFKKSRFQDCLLPRHLSVVPLKRFGPLGSVGCHLVTLTGGRRQEIRF